MFSKRDSQFSTCAKVEKERLGTTESRSPSPGIRFEEEQVGMPHNMHQKPHMPHMSHMPHMLHMQVGKVQQH